MTEPLIKNIVEEIIKHNTTAYILRSEINDVYTHVGVFTDDVPLLEFFMKIIKRHETSDVKFYGLKLYSQARKDFTSTNGSMEPIPMCSILGLDNSMVFMKELLPLYMKDYSFLGVQVSYASMSNMYFQKRRSFELHTIPMNVCFDPTPRLNL